MKQFLLSFVILTAALSSVAESLQKDMVAPSSTILCQEATGTVDIAVTIFNDKAILNVAPVASAVGSESYNMNLFYNKSTENSVWILNPQPVETNFNQLAIVSVEGSQAVAVATLMMPNGELFKSYDMQCEISPL